MGLTAVAHEEHWLAFGPRLVAGRWFAVCGCGVEVRGITREALHEHFDQHLADMRKQS